MLGGGFGTPEMSWQTYVRRPRPPGKRTPRVPGRLARGTEREYRPLDVDPAVVEDAAQLRRYDGYIAQLTSLHLECGEQWDWSDLASAPPPEPEHHRTAEAAARKALEAFKPGLADRLTGRATRRRTRLVEKIDRAIEADRRDHEAAQAAHRTAVERWRSATAIAPAVLQLDEPACREAVRFLESFADIAAFGTRVELDSIYDDVAIVSCTLADPDIVPKQELTLSVGGRLATVETEARKYWALYNVHVCSCAIRIAREVFAALPVAHVIVNVSIENLPGGAATVLAVQFTTQLLDRLMERSTDPWDLIRVFPHRMHFHSSIGFETIQRMAPDEQSLTR